MPPIVTCLWFDTDGLAAAELYASVFPDGKIIGTSRYTEAGPGPAGSVMTVEFEIGGSRFLALNGGPQFTFTEAISFQVMCATQAGPGPAGSVMTVEFEIGGSRFLALNGGPQFTFTEAISFQVMCATQAEVDHYWARLSEGGQENVCGWLKDRFGVSWQIVPDVLPRLLVGEDRARAQRVTQAMFGMTKPDIAVLERA